MAGRTRMSSHDEVRVAPCERPFFLFGGDGRRKVRCRTRWMTDKYAYVVAPMATATLVRQRWQAATTVPQTEPVGLADQELQVELVSAETLLGADSGKEGLLLRFLGPQMASPVEERDARAVGRGRMSPISRATAGA